MKNKQKKIDDGNVFDINNKTFKHNDIVKVIKNREEFSKYKEGKFYAVDCKLIGIPLLVNNNTGNAYPIYDLDADLEIQNPNLK
jgi:hypothetical protein